MSVSLELKPEVQFYILRLVSKKIENELKTFLMLYRPKTLEEKTIEEVEGDAFKGALPSLTMVEKACQYLLDQGVTPIFWGLDPTAEKGDKRIQISCIFEPIPPER